MYAWTIDRDHLAEDARHDGVASSDIDDASGTFGPSDAPQWQIDALNGVVQSAPAQGGQIFTFRLYDDDGELYYTGRMITDEGDTEDACYAPLGDFGAPYAGCTLVRYVGHPEMDCG